MREADIIKVVGGAGNTLVLPPTAINTCVSNVADF
uniref:Uncharacterized protein n=1 Tax=Anguilla anguilla TaxID=7936 RepID=A0A0E9T3M8_ANGAN